jgi:16S rRNA (guanine(966)-N(2))-methyltransferase RsmD
MRVIAGKYKGRCLTAPKGTMVRPTSDRVKESIFSIIQGRVIDSKFLDLCAGTGNIGIEALSRGAKQVAFLEKNLRCMRLIEQNLRVIGLDINQTDVQLIRSDAVQGINQFHKQSKSFELIYLDPPYDSDLYYQCLSNISDTNVLENTGILLVEHAKHRELPSVYNRLCCYRNKQYGDTCVSFYRIEQN